MVLKHLYEIKDDSCIPKNYGTILDIIRNVRSIPTAFDKEKVKQELEIASKLYRISEKDCEFAIPQNIAFELIEKGGTE